MTGGRPSVAAQAARPKVRGGQTARSLVSAHVRKPLPDERRRRIFAAADSGAQHTGDDSAVR